MVEAIVEKLRIARQIRGLSMYRVAKMTRLHPSTIGLIERGLRSPSLFVVMKIAWALEVQLGPIVSECAQRPEEKPSSVELAQESITVC